MTNPLNRGSAPDRAREAWDRPGSFERGHQKVGGRKKGTPNSIPANVKNALLEAAHRVGSDGQDGIVGYFRWLGVHEPRVFLSEILLRILVLEEYEHQAGEFSVETASIMNVDAPEPNRHRIEELLNFIEELLNFPPEKRPDPTQVTDLMRVAVDQPKAFARTFGVAWLMPPKDWRRRLRARRKYDC